MDLLICILLIRGLHLETWWYAIAVAVWLVATYIPRPSILFRKKD